MDSLWNIARLCFASEDDGSLPGIEITKLSREGVSRVYGLLRHRSHLHGDTPTFWSHTQDEELPIDSVPDAAGLVAIGEAHDFCLCIEGLIAGGTELPVLGVFVRPDRIKLDYRMGQEWGPAQVSGFFELLWDCYSLDSGAVVVPAECEGPPYPDRFLKAWESYKKYAEPDSRCSGPS